MIKKSKKKNTDIAIVEEAVLPTDHQDLTTQIELKKGKLPECLIKRSDPRENQASVEKISKAATSVELPEP